MTQEVPELPPITTEALIARLLDYACDHDYTRKDGTRGTTNQAEAMRQSVRAITQAVADAQRLDWILSHCWSMRWSFHKNGDLRGLHIEARPTAIASQAVRNDITRGIDAAMRQGAQHE
jgi:hypothetical protein